MCGYILEKKNDTVLDSEKQETFVEFIVTWKPSSPSYRGNNPIFNLKNLTQY